MRTLLIAAALAAGAALAGPASAQYYDYGRGYDRPPPPDYDYRPRRRGWDDDDGYDRPRPRYDRGYGGHGSICVTARGSCPTGRRLPHAAPCGCEIPGFGYKRGAVQ